MIHCPRCVSGVVVLTPAAVATSSGYIAKARPVVDATGKYCKTPSNFLSYSFGPAHDWLGPVRVIRFRAPSAISGQPS